MVNFKERQKITHRHFKIVFSSCRNALKLKDDRKHNKGVGLQKRVHPLFVAESLNQRALPRSP